MITGDHVLPTFTPVVGLYPWLSLNPLGDYLNSLKAVKELKVEIALPGHGDSFTGIKQRVQHIIQHHKQRNSEILRVLNTEPKTAYQIAINMTWMSGSVGWQKLASPDKTLAIGETLAHLEEMRAREEVSKFVKDNIIYYRIENARD